MMEMRAYVSASRSAAQSRPLPRARSAGDPLLQMQRAVGNQTMQRALAPGHTVQREDAPPIVDDALSDSGQSLDATTRSTMQSRLGRDFGDVRVHTNALAAESADALRARAYTVGRDVVFARDAYDPHTIEGRHLIAHELTHVVQQNGSADAGVVQRAEVDDRSCSGLKNIESDIDTFVNSEIAAARRTVGTPALGPLLVLRVMQRLGGRSPISPIETFVEGLSATKRRIPPNDLSGTKYSGAGSANRFYLAQALGAAHVVGSSANIHGLCIGADKLGHFFDQGFDYWDAASKPGATPGTIDDLGKAMEGGVFGLGSTGVFSNADIAANLAGLKFYKDLEANPDRFRFHIRNYLTPNWNEQTNPSFYDAPLASVVWSNLLNGRWEGKFTQVGTGRDVRTVFDLIATTSGTVSGTFELEIASVAAGARTVTLKNGVITQRTTSLTIPSAAGGAATTATPVSGITIEFDWERGGMSGKGRLDSAGEQTLIGTLGGAGSNSGTGTLRIIKA